MRHRKHSQQLGVKKEHRSALLANLASSLIMHGRIRTTTAKAKALRPFVERVISLTKRGSDPKKIHQRRLAVSRLRNKDAVSKLFNERADDFAKRPGGYTRIYKLADPRLGDAADMAIIEFVGAGDPGYQKTRRRAKGKSAKRTPKAAVESAENAPAAAPAAAEESAAPAEGEKKE
jgi:large subunit ribosomal protein L17